MLCNLLYLVNMKPNEIRAALLLKNITLAEIAKQLGVHRPHISAVIYGNRPTRYVREAIAKAIDLPVEQVFTDPQSKEAA